MPTVPRSRSRWRWRGWNATSATDCAGTTATARSPTTSPLTGSPSPGSTTCSPAPGNPQLHTHAVVANLLHGAEGAWSAMDTRAVYGAGRTAGFIYQAALRSELTARVGVGWSAPARGVGEVAGIGAHLRGVFSTRRRQIQRALYKAARAGQAATPAAAQAACLTTRPDKDHHQHQLDHEQLQQQWRTRAAAARHNVDAEVTAALEHSTNGGHLATGPVDTDAVMRQVTDELLGPGGLTAHATTFDTRDVVRALCQTLPSEVAVDLALLDAACARVLADPRAVPLTTEPDTARDSTESAPATGTDTARRWSTRELLDLEADALTLASALATSPARQAPPVRVLTQDPAALRVVLGPPGSGKTTALRAAGAIWHRTGTQVRTVALAGMATQALTEATGRPAFTIAATLSHINQKTRHGHHLMPPGAVLVVDEAGMVDTRDLHALMAEAHAAQWTVVLVGDDHQLPEIGPGAYTAHDRVHIHPDPEAQHAAAAEAYLHAAAVHGPDQVGLYTATRASAASLSDLVRERLADTGP